MIARLGHGQVWWADLPGDEIRPVVVLTRAAVAPRLHRALVAPVTSTVRGIATEVPLGAAEGVRTGSVANWTTPSCSTSSASSVSPVR